MDILTISVGQKNLLIQRLDFSFENKIETMDRLPKMQSLEIVEKRLDFPFENNIETMDSLPKIQGQKIVETMVRFST